MLGIFQARCLSQSDNIKELQDQLVSAEKKLQVDKIFFFVYMCVYVLDGLCMNKTYGSVLLKC